MKKVVVIGSALVGFGISMYWHRGDGEWLVLAPLLGAWIGNYVYGLAVDETADDTDAADDL